MGLLIEIGLTIWAWKRGWKAWALAPLGSVIAVGFVIGFYCGAANIPVEDMGWAVVLDLAAMAVLVVMGATGRKTSPVAHYGVEGTASVLGQREETRVAQ